MAEYKYLFTPIKLGTITLKNRIVCAAHGTQMADPVNFLVTDRAKAYYEERARGGASAIILVASSVDERADFYPANNFALWSDDVIPGLKELADIIHKHDCKFIGQPSHPGIHNICHVQVDEVPMGPSQVPAVEVPNQIPWELTREEIWEIQDKFAAGAERFVKAGLDGIELMYGHEKLTSAFLSPLSNKRTDEYGGSLENRFRFTREIIDKVRQAIGPDFPMGIRVNVAEMEMGGLSLEEGIQLAQMFEATGQVNWLGCLVSTYRSMPFELNPYCAGFEPGWAGEFSRQVKAAVRIPVNVSSKINDPGLIDQMIAEGKCDYVYLARTLIADPHFPRKALEGKEEDIRPCIYCNQGCVGRSFVRGTTNGTRCSVNPTNGEEIRWGSWNFKKTPERKKILIVGAGPAGLQCALTSARRGHEAVVYDKADEIGGQARFIKKMPSQTMPQTFLDYLDLQLKKLGVKIHLETEISTHNDTILDREKPDVVVVATGARPAADGRGGLTTFPIPGWEGDNVRTYEDVLSGAALGEKILIVDELADRISPGMAELLAEQGKQVHVLTRWASLSPNLHMWMDEPFALGKLDMMGVKVTPDSWVKEITEKGAVCLNIFSFREFEIEADTIVLATMKYSNTDLYKYFREKEMPCYIIGDARAPRWIWNAIHDGYKVASEL